MIQTPVGKLTKHDRGAGAGHGVAPIPLTRARTGIWPTAQWRAAHVLPSGSQAFRILVFGSSIPMLGTRISTLAFPMLVLGIKNSPLIAGIVAFAVIAPGVLLYMPAGAIVDRRDPRRVMLVSEIFRELSPSSLLPALLIFGRNINHYLPHACDARGGSAQIFSTPAHRRCLNRLIERDKIRSRQASVEVRTHAAVLFGRPSGRSCLRSSFLPFLADAISFVASAFSLLSIESTNRTAGNRMANV